MLKIPSIAALALALAARHDAGMSADDGPDRERSREQPSRLAVGDRAPLERALMAG